MLKPDGYQYCDLSDAEYEDQLLAKSKIFILNREYIDWGMSFVKADLKNPMIISEYARNLSKSLQEYCEFFCQRPHDEILAHIMQETIYYDMIELRSLIAINDRPLNGTEIRQLVRYLHKTVREFTLGVDDIADWAILFKAKRPCDPPACNCYCTTTVSTTKTVFLPEQTLLPSPVLLSCQT